MEKWRCAIAAIFRRARGRCIESFAPPDEHEGACPHIGIGDAREIPRA